MLFHLVALQSNVNKSPAPPRNFRLRFRADIPTVKMSDVLTNPGFYTIQRTIIGLLDIKSLRQCRLVSKDWRQLIDNCHLFWPIILSRKQEKRLDWIRKSCPHHCSVQLPYVFYYGTWIFPCSVHDNWTKVIDNVLDTAIPKECKEMIGYYKSRHEHAWSSPYSAYMLLVWVPSKSLFKP